MTDTPTSSGPSTRPADLHRRIATLERGLELARLHRAAALTALEARTEEELLSGVLEDLCPRIRWPVGRAFLRRGDGRYHPVESWHLERSEDFARIREFTRTSSFAPGEGTIGRVVASRRAEWIADLRSGADLSRNEPASMEVRSVFASPLLVGDDVLGVMEFLSDEIRPEEPDLVEVLVDIGAQVAVGLDRIRAVRALRVSEEKFSGIVSISAEGMISIDADQRIILFNEGAEEIFGYDAEEVLGRDLDMLIPERFHDVHREHLRSFGALGERARRMGERREVFGIRKSGEEFPAQASISKLDVDGQILYSVVLRDVTDQEAYEESLRRHATELERSNRELEQFAFVASHDLQEPLRKIQAFSDRLISRYGDELDERGHDYLERMHRASERMSSLIQDLLTFSRVTTRAQPFEAVDLDGVVQHAVSDLDERIRESDAQVEIGRLPTIQADPSQMRQLFQNLIGNALKYHRKGVPPRVEIRSRTLERGEGEGSGEPTEGSGLEIQVRDNGIGFDDQYAERIFGIFDRLHGRGEYEGTGIGLAICRKIVERHSGTLTATGAPGEGATFTVRLPAESTAIPTPSRFEVVELLGREP